MAWAKPTKITAWSFSRYSVYAQCPLKAKLKFIDKLPEPGSPQMERGSQMHTVIEQYIKGAVPRMGKIPEALASQDYAKGIEPKQVSMSLSADFSAMMKGLRARHKKDPAAVSVEDTLAYRADWSPTRWDDWSGCWLRIKIDCAEIDGTADSLNVSVIDWKSGRFRPMEQNSYALQLDLYALGMLTKYKDVKDVTVLPSLVYLDEGHRHTVGEYTLADLPRLKKEWTQRTKAMLNDTKFAPRPNSMCRFCEFSAAKSGPCKY